MNDPVLVRVSSEQVLQLAAKDSEPVVVMGLKRYDDDTYDLLLKKPEGQDELYRAVHAMLVERLVNGQDSPEFLTAINRVIDVHDSIAERLGHEE